MIHEKKHPTALPLDMSGIRLRRGQPQLCLVDDVAAPRCYGSGFQILSTISGPSTRMRAFFSFSMPFPRSFPVLLTNASRSFGQIILGGFIR